MVKMENKDINYVIKLLQEISEDTRFCYELEVLESRRTGIIEELNIRAKNVEEFDF